MSKPGINVVGLLGLASGLGNTARLFIAALQNAGYPVAGFDLAADMADPSIELPTDTVVSDIEALPFATNLVIASADRLPQMWLRHAPGLLNPRFRNAGMFFWELPTIPRAWVPSLEMFDAIVVCSHYVRQTLETAVRNVPTVFAEHPIPKHQVSAATSDLRQRFGIPVDAVAFCCVYDMRSGHGRKNPMGAIKAWKRAFPDDADVCLVIKTHGGQPSRPNDRRQLQAAIGGDARVVVIAEQLEHASVLDLLACCDVVVSLHRSEGLGLVPLEAMSLGKPVIATGYSGNLTFMTQQNSILVNYRLVTPVQDQPMFMPPFAGGQAMWAEPDLSEAAEAMRRCRGEPALRARLGAQARADVGLRQATAWAAPFAADMLAALSAPRIAPHRGRLRTRILLNEILDPTLRQKNLRMSAQRFRSMLRLPPAS